MPGRLHQKVAIVTGASSGIGRAISLAYHREGAYLVCADLRPDARAESPSDTDTPTHEAITSDGGKAIFVKCDVGEAKEVEALVQKAVDEFGRVDVMVNNAGIAIEAWAPQPIWEFSEDTWDKTLLINAKGVFLGCKYAAAQMVKQEPREEWGGDRGWIVNLASVLGLGGSTNNSSYVSAKHAVVGLTKVVALDCAPKRIHCNAICPGYTATAMTASVFKDENFKSRLQQMHPFRGLGEPEDLAMAAVTLASADARWITGVSLPVDGGYTAI
ncbi:hypothetical protein W97_02925 [Coniosporium apollinis CBS 100218]|uniref:Uncharacterized protein n=1 Tax=Coniosporium apollinis (strain CBS 100218) TaxID=1168221 RepID=R7YP74_CONA1|nr:uncharacterized protein W97_02925 [Coniosporium apollinis CBS 100218]EON63697.1 hypothetical protein W97_02925 [Coniosporium apollinis CBS 100218]